MEVPKLSVIPAHLVESFRSSSRVVGERECLLGVCKRLVEAAGPSGAGRLRNGDTYARLAAGFGVGVATVFRYIGEAVDLLAAHAPSLTAALWQFA